MFLYLEPPHSIPVGDTAFWEAHSDAGGQYVEWEGHDGRKYSVRSLCTSLPPHCYSCRNSRPGASANRKNAVPLFPSDCPRCSRRDPAEVVSELIRTIRDGVRTVSKDMRLIFWNWSWTIYVDSPCREILDALPSDVALMADFERGGIRKDGAYINEYSLSYSGPSEQFLETFGSARKRGIEMYAKLQLGTTHELGAVRSLPLIGNLFHKADFIRKNGLDGFMECWNFGNLESANVRAFNYFLEMKGNPSTGGALVSFAENFFPDCKAIMLSEAWTLFGKAMEKYPFSIPFLYNSAVNAALSLIPPPGPLDGKKFGRAWLPDERGFDLSGSITETFPLEAVTAAFKSISEVWERGLVLMREAMKDSKDEWALRELGNAEICGRVWRSTYLVYSMFALKRNWTAACNNEFVRLYKQQKENMRSSLPYLDRDPLQGYHLEGRFHCFSGELAGACREKGIRLAAYFNGTLSDAEARLHRDWMVITPEGRVYPEVSRITPYCRKLCMNSPWREHLASMMDEVFGKYVIAGFFVDCVHPQKCVCPYCVEKMKARGLDVSRPEDIEKFSFDSAVEFCAFLSELIRKRNPEATVCFNGGLEEPLRDSVSHVECECLPTAGWGYSFLPVAAHYFRNAAPGKSVMNMTGRFLDWGDFGGLRSRASLEFDMFYGTASGMRPDIGTHLPPSGQWETPVFERIREVYREMPQYDRWTLGAENRAEIAVVSAREPSGIVCNTSVKGAGQMLSELKHPFEIFSEDGSWDRYPLVIFPDTMRFSPRMPERVRKYVADGGRIISSGSSSMAWEKDEFTLPELWGATAEPGGLPFTPAYFSADREFSPEQPDMPLAVYGDGVPVQPFKKSEVAAHFIRPLVSRGWDGVCADYYTPPGEKSDLPFLFFHGCVAVFASELFFGYANSGALPLRMIFADTLKRLFSKPLVKVDGLPSYARIFVQENGHFVLVHILSYLPEKRVNAFVVEERLPIPPCRVSLRRDGRRFRKVVLCPDGHERPFSQDGEYCVADLPSGEGYALASFEFA